MQLMGHLIFYNGLELTEQLQEHMLVMGQEMTKDFKLQQEKAMVH